MRIHAVDPKTGKRFSGEAAELDQAKIDSFLDKFDASKSEINRWTGRLNISADAKAILSNIASTVIWAGEFVIRTGRRIPDIIRWLLREFPKATFGLILGVVIGSLVGSIPAFPG